MATKKIYLYCAHCKGTGTLILTKGSEPPLEEPCPYCDAKGKIEAGEIEN
jgi:DnaJ-class molecular chaperone